MRDASSFELWASLFAGDFVLLFQSRDEIIRGSSHIFAHLRKFGLCMRMLVAVTQHSKLRQCTFRRRERRMRPRTRLAFTLMAPASLISLRSLKFMYLGSILYYSLTCDADVGKR